MQVAIMLYPGFTALDFIGPYESLRYLPDAEVRFVWHETGPIAADSRVLLVGATHTFDETPSPDLVLIPGGFSTIEHARDEGVLDWVRSAHQTSTWTTSVCSGQPPFDSGHMSKASASTKATATAMMGKELARPAALAATGGLLWDAALQRVRRGKRSRAVAASRSR